MTTSAGAHVVDASRAVVRVVFRSFDRATQRRVAAGDARLRRAPDPTPNVGGSSAASRTARRPLVPAPTSTTRPPLASAAATSAIACAICRCGRARGVDRGAAASRSKRCASATSSSRSIAAVAASSASVAGKRAHAREPFARCAARRAPVRPRLDDRGTRHVARAAASRGDTRAGCSRAASRRRTRSRGDASSSSAAAQHRAHEIAELLRRALHDLRRRAVALAGERDDARRERGDGRRVQRRVVERGEQRGTIGRVDARATRSVVSSRVARPSSTRP